MLTRYSLFIELFTKANTCSTLSTSSTVLQSFTPSQLIPGPWTNRSLPSLSKQILLNTRLIHFTLQWSTLKRKHTPLLQSRYQNTTHSAGFTAVVLLTNCSEAFSSSPKSPFLSQSRHECSTECAFFDLACCPPGILFSCLSTPSRLFKLLTKSPMRSAFSYCSPTLVGASL